MIPVLCGGQTKMGLALRELCLGNRSNGAVFTAPFDLFLYTECIESVYMSAYPHSIDTAY